MKTNNYSEQRLTLLWCEGRELANVNLQSRNKRLRTSEATEVGCMTMSVTVSQIETMWGAPEVT